MVYPWSRKPKDENEASSEDNEEKSDTPDSDESISNNELEDNPVKEEKSEVWDPEDPRSIMLNILKLEGYKMDSGTLFIAFKEASKNDSEAGMMEDFKNALEELANLGKIKNDSEGNIMTIEEHDREKSQSANKESKEEDAEEPNGNDKNDESSNEETNDESSNEETNDESSSEDLESIIKLKEETDSWLIEKLKNNESIEENNDLRKEMDELKTRVEKLEKIIKNMTRAFE